MFIYKIQLTNEDIFVGGTYRSIAKKRWGHRVCAKNDAPIGEPYLLTFD